MRGWMCNPLAPGIPMHLLTERGLNGAFLEAVEQHRRAGLPVVVRREGQLTCVPVDGLAPEITRVKKRIVQLTTEIAKYEHGRVSENRSPEIKGRD